MSSDLLNRFRQSLVRSRQDRLLDEDIQILLDSLFIIDFKLQFLDVYFHIFKFILILLNL